MIAWIKKIWRGLFPDTRCVCGNPWSCDSEHKFLALSKPVGRKRMAYDPVKTKNCWVYQKRKRELARQVEELNIGG